MNHKERVTGSDLRRVAELANLELTEAEETSMLRDLNSILDHVAQLNELDTSRTSAMAQVNEVLGDPSGERIFLRNDTLIPSLDRTQVMACAPDSDRTFFLVPKVIER